MARKRLLTVEEAVLLHLLNHIRVQPGDTAPMEMTQAGISRAVGARRSHVSLSLESARQRGTVEEHLSHVRWEKRKRKCYFLTPAGMEQARGVQSRVLDARVEASLPDGASREGTLSELMASCCKGMGLAAVALRCSGGKLDVPGETEPELQARDAWRPPKPGALFGRERELAALRKVFAGEVRAAVVAGMPGIGKTALVAAAATQPGSRSVFWLGIREWSSPRNACGHLARFLRTLGCERLARYLANHPKLDLADVHDILAASEASAALVLDDMHRASAEMATFAEMLAQACMDNPRMSLCVAGRRADMLSGAHPGSESTLRMNLGPLDEESSAAMLARRGFSPEEARAVARRSGGNALYLSLAAPGLGAEAAKDIEGALAREADASLSDAERSLLQTLSVYREPVPGGAVAESEEGLRALDGLIARSLVSDCGGLCLHSVLRDFYYSRQPAADRRSRHEMAAEFYMRRGAGAGDAVEEVHHLFMAGQADSAIMALASAGRGVLAHGYAEETLALCAMAPADWKNAEESFDLEFIRGSALDMLGRWQEATAAYRKCIAISDVLGDGERRAETLRRLGAISYRRGDISDAEALFGEALGIARSDPVVAELHGSLGVAQWKLGRVGEARASHGRDLEMSRAAADPRGMSRALNNLGILDWQAGDNALALERYSEALAQAEMAGDKRLVAIIYSNIGDVRRALGQQDEARRYYERCLGIAEDLKFNWQVAEAYRGLAEVVPERRRDYLSRALNIFDRLGAAEDAKTVRGMMA